MKKKWWLIGLATLALCGGIAVAIPALQPPGPGVTKANFDRIGNGMSEVDVAALLGRPTRRSDYTDDQGIVFGYWYSGNDDFASVVFRDGRAVQWEWVESTESIPDKLRRWLSLPRK